MLFAETFCAKKCFVDGAYKNPAIQDSTLYYICKGPKNEKIGASKKYDREFDVDKLDQKEICQKDYNSTAE